MPEYIDSHCHITCDRLFPRIDEIMENCKKNNVSQLLVVCCERQEALRALQLKQKYPMIRIAYGFYPCDTYDLGEDDYTDLENFCREGLLDVIGEIGLDYHYDDTDKEIQRMVFNRQLEIAEKFNKPVVVHSRDSIGETYNILSKYNLKGSIHCYSGSLEMAKLFIKLGYKLGVGGIITFKNAKNIKEVVKNIDLSYILLETDSPYLSPEPYRGSENNPSNIPVIAESIASIKGVTNIDVARVTTANAEEVFDFL